MSSEDMHPASNPAANPAYSYPPLLAGLASLYAIRMLGLFMILPVLPLYSGELAGASALTVGVALSIYSAAQALLQYPFGRLSDRFGRRTMLLWGLSFFLVGSLVAAWADSIIAVILGRLLQGMGAITSVLLACVGDWIPAERRLGAMAAIGAAISLSFVLGLVFGPLLNAHFGLSAVFLSNALLALAAIILVWRVFPGGCPTHFAAAVSPLRLLRRLRFAICCAGVCTLHILLIASFSMLPVLLRDHLGVSSAQHWHWYLGVLSVVALCTFPVLLRIRSSPEILYRSLVYGTAMTAVALIWLAFIPSIWWHFAICLIGLFAAFALLEAALPALASSEYPTHLRGAAMGCYATAQFLGASLGGIAGGLLQTYGNATLLFGVCATLASLWWLGLCLLPRPSRFPLQRDN